MRLWNALVAVTLIGVADTAYLAWTHLFGTEVACFGGGGCEAVQASRFGTLAGLPLGYLGLGFYATVLALASLGRGHPAARSVTLGALFPLTLSAAVFSAYLTGVQRFVLADFCSWCLVSAAVAATLFGLTLALVWRLPSR